MAEVVHNALVLVPVVLNSSGHQLGGNKVLGVFTIINIYVIIM